MTAALLTAIVMAVASLVGGLVLGYTAESSEALFRHISFSTFATLIVLLAHSMTMFYLIGKGKAIREAAEEGELGGAYFAEIARLRRPVFSIGTIAMGLTMLTAILGAGVDTGVLPIALHSWLGLAAVAANLAAARAELAALNASSRIVTEINRILGA